MDSADVQLSLEELRHVLSNPVSFLLKEFAWYAIDAPQHFVDEHPEHALAARLGSSAAELGALSDVWLSAGKRVLDATPTKPGPLLSELNGSRRQKRPELGVALRSRRSPKPSEP